MESSDEQRKKEDAKRKKERTELLRKMLEDEFGEYEVLHGRGGSRYGIDCEVELAVEHNSGRPRVVLCLSLELLTDVGVPFERRFKEGIEQAKHYIESREGVCIVKILTGGVELHEI